MIKQSATISIGQISLKRGVVLKDIAETAVSAASSTGHTVRAVDDEIRIGGSLFGTKIPCVKLVNEDHRKDYYHVCIFLPSRR